MAANFPMQSKYASSFDMPVRLVIYWAEKNNLWGGLRATQPNYGRAIAGQQLMQMSVEQLAAVEAECLAAYEVESAASRAGADPDRVLTPVLSAKKSG
jgi:hypothetical protein